MGESCNARNLINYLIKLFFWNICEVVLKLIGFNYFIKWRNNIRIIILLVWAYFEGIKVIRGCIGFKPNKE